MANDEQTPDSLLPPKLDLRKKGIVKGPPAEDAAAGGPSAPQPAESAPPTPAAADEPKEPVVTKPAGSPPEVSKTVAGARPVAVPQTVRIATPPAAQGSEGDGPAATPKTIRIAPLPAASTGAAERPKTVRVKTPADTAVPPAAPAGVETTAQTLKKDSPKPGSTVPIPLDDLAAPVTADQPKTIRLKKPAGGATRPGTARVALKAGDEGAPADAPAGSPPTRKRTIKVKRPDRGARKGRPMTVARTKVKAAKATATADEAVVAEVGASAKPAAAVQAETGAVAVLTVVAAVVAMIVVGVVAYLFAVQAFPLMGLPWPGIS